MDSLATVTVTLAPPDVTVTGVTGRRINLYLYAVRENASLKHQESPGHGHPSVYGHPPLSLDLYYLMTAYGESETAADADLAAQQRPTALANGLTLNVNVPPGLPILFGAPHYLSMAIQGLLDNALRYTPSGGSIDLRAVDKGNAIHVSVSDTGVGISPEILHYVFDRFYRLDEAHSTQGFGLGLSIAQKVAERHRGRILVESTPGQGSVFVLELPLLPVQGLHADEGSPLT